MKQLIMNVICTVYTAVKLIDIEFVLYMYNKAPDRQLKPLEEKLIENFCKKGAK